MLYGVPEEEKGENEEPVFEVTEAVADVELFGFGINTRSIHVLSGAYVLISLSLNVAISYCSLADRAMF